MENKKREKIELIKKSFDLKSLKHYKEALEYLYKALEYDDIDQDNIELLAQIGDLHILLGNYDRALEEFQKALSLNSSHIYSIQKCFEILYTLGHYNKALKIANQMCEKSKTPQNYFNYFKVLIKLGKEQDAVEIFNNLNENIKLDVDILYLISTISDFNKRKLLLEKIIQIDDTYLKANLELAEIEFENKNYQNVIQYCLNVDEENSMALYYLGCVEEVRGNFQRAVDLFLKAISLDEDKHDLYLALARVYIDISWLDEALVALKKSINFSIKKGNNDELNEKYFLSGWILIRKKEYSKALLNLDLISKESEYYSRAQILIQSINFKGKNIANSLKILEKYSIYESDNLILLDTLGIIYKELNMHTKAINVYKKALELYPDSVYYAIELIDLYIDVKEYDLARELIAKFGEQYKNCANIYNSLARIYYRMKEYDNTLSSLETYLKLDCNNAETYYFKGLTLNDMERYAEAQDAIYQAIKLNPVCAKYYYQMGKSYFGLKKYQDALLYIKEAMEINPDEIAYKKFAYDTAVLIEDENLIKAYKKQLERSEKVIKTKR